MKILFRNSYETREECRVASKYFDVVELRTDCENDVVIGRYSVLPHYNELFRDLLNQNSLLINSPTQHDWIASFDYYEAIKEFTPRTWTDANFYKSDHHGPFVVKGATNSRKFSWNSMMFAEDKRSASNIASLLKQDSLIGQQGNGSKSIATTRNIAVSIFLSIKMRK